MNIKNASNTIFTKVFILIFLGIFFVLIIFSYQAAVLQKESILDNIKSKAENMGKSITLVSTDAMIINDEIKILEFVYDFVQVNKDIKKLIVDSNNANKLIIKQNHWELKDESVNNVITPTLQNKSTNISYSLDFKEDVFKYSYPVYLSSVHWGWLHFELSLSEYNDKLNNMYKQFLFLAVIIALTMILISYVIAKMISKPIITLEDISQEIYNGNLSRRVMIKSNDEIGKLSITFNKMIDNLEKSQIELKKSHNELEHRVKMRTDELESKSKQLAELNNNLEKIVQDEILKRQKQEQLLIQQSKLASMGEMIGNIAHQWRQPLNALSLVIQNIQLSYMMDELDDKFIEKSVNKANLLTATMSKTIDDFRNFFKANKEVTKFSLDTSVRNAITLIGSTLNHNNINIEYKPNGEINVIGFPNEFSQVILNIITNSKDAIVDNKIDEGKVSIEIKSNETHGLIIIKDNAGGIPLNLIEKVFDPYFTTKEEGKGTGIGLYMSKIIIEKNMNGKLYVDNIVHGAVFTVIVPISK